MRDIKEMAKEAGFSSAAGKHIGLDQDLERFAELVRADERNSFLQQKPYRPLQDNGSKYFGPSWDKADEALDRMAENARELGLDYEPVLLRDAIVGNLLREGINKHKARELADHFVGLQAAQRTWVGLTDGEIEQGCKESWVAFQAWQSAVWWAEAKLKEKNATAQPVVPDAIGPTEDELPAYAAGWNDCRQAMLSAKRVGV